MLKVTSTQLHRAPAKTRKRAKSGPVLITERGLPTHVILSIEEFEALSAQREPE